MPSTDQRFAIRKPDGELLRDVDGNLVMFDSKAEARRFTFPGEVVEAGPAPEAKNED